ncbi:hypothetical protein FCN82_29150 [Klebsiella variicola]|nr:hypothetical protein FCN82_29150 [Klebsiella variicola]
MYNSKRPHKSLELMTPVDYILRESKNCNMWWTHTIARYGHNGSAGDRSNAFSCAMNKARSLQNYSGAKLDYNVYEETA